MQKTPLSHPGLTLRNHHSSCTHTRLIPHTASPCFLLGCSKLLLVAAAPNYPFSCWLLLPVNGLQNYTQLPRDTQAPSLRAQASHILKRWTCFVCTGCIIEITIHPKTSFVFKDFLTTGFFLRAIIWIKLVCRFLMFLHHGLLLYPLVTPR